MNNSLIPILDLEPVNGVEGDVYFNTTNNQIYIFAKGEWEVIKYGTFDPGRIKQIRREERLSKLLDKKDDKS